MPFDTFETLSRKTPKYWEFTWAGIFYINYIITRQQTSSVCSYEVDKSIYGDEHEAGTAQQLSELPRSSRETREALKLYEKAVEIDNKIYGKHHPETATASVNLGRQCQNLAGMSRDARFEKPLKLKKKS